MVYDKRHNGPFDRGGSDSYYRRGCLPHYYAGMRGSAIRIEKKDMTPEEIEAYMAGYAENEFDFVFKDFG